MIAVIFALKDEVVGLLKWQSFKPQQKRGGLPRIYKSKKQAGLILVEGGIGGQGAEKATRRVIEEYKPEAILSVGFAGGAKGGAGDLFVCRRLYSVTGPPALWNPKDAGEPLEANEDLLNRTSEALKEGGLEFRYGNCLSVPYLASKASLKRWLGDAFSVEIVDMESYWVARVASQHRVPHLAIRSVLDTVEESLPPFVGQTVADGGKGRWTKAALYAAANPARVPALIRLAKKAGDARGTLVEALSRALPKLCKGEGLQEVHESSGNRSYGVHWQ